MTNYFWFSSSTSMSDSWVREQALELCNLIGIQLIKVHKDPVYKKETKEAFFSGKEVTKTKFQCYRYSIDVEGVVPDESTVPLALNAFLKGYNSTRPNWS